MRKQRINLSGCHFEGCEEAIEFDGPDTDFAVDNTTFKQNGRDLKIDQVRRLKLSNNDHPSDEEAVEETNAAKLPAQRRFFSGFSFSKGDHIK